MATRAPRRRRAHNHLILGDPAEYKADLEEAEKRQQVQDTQHRHAEQHDLETDSTVPASVAEAMQLSQDLRGPLLRAYKAVRRERWAMRQQSESLELREDAFAVTKAHTTAAGALAATRDHRILQKHEQQELSWAVQAARLGAVLGKDPKDVALARATEFRKRREKVDHILKSKPVHERVPGSIFWQLTLRDAHTHFIPLGNEFSGLFTTVHEAPPELTAAPVEVLGKPAALDTGRLASAASALPTGTSGQLSTQAASRMRSMYDKGRAWLQSGYLRTVEDRYKASMRRLMAHTPETSELAVMGASKAAELRQLAAMPVSLDDVLQRLAQDDGAAFERYQALRAAQLQAAQEAAAAELQKAADALAAAQAAAAPAGPVLTVDKADLTLECHHDGTCSGIVTIAATGSAAVYYAWSRRRLQPRGVAGAGQKDEPSPIYMPDLRGAILPRQAKPFRFTFEPRRPGICIEEWQLRTQPERATVHGGRQITVRGVAVAHDDWALARRQLAAQLAHQQKQRLVADALDAILRSVPEPAPQRQALSAAEWAEHSCFVASTLQREPPVYWQPGLAGQLQEMHAELRAALTPPADPKKKPKKGEEAAQPPVPEHFDGRIDSLQSHIELLRRAAPAQLAPGAPSADSIQARLDALLATAALPRNPTVLFTRALRKLLLAASEAIPGLAREAMAGAVEAESARRAAAGAAQQAAQPAKPSSPPAGKGKGGKDAAPAAPPPPPAYDATEYRAELESRVHTALRGALNGTEPAVHEELLHVGSVLDAQVSDAQDRLVAAEGAGDAGAAAEAVWDTFALLRTRHAYRVPSEPRPLKATAAPLHITAGALFERGSAKLL